MKYACGGASKNATIPLVSRHPLGPVVSSWRVHVLACYLDKRL